MAGTFEEIGALPQLRKDRPIIPKEATFFEYLKQKNFSRELEKIILYFQAEQLINRASEPNDVKNHITSCLMDDIHCYIRHVLESYNEVLLKHVVFTTTYFNGLREYKLFYDSDSFETCHSFTSDYGSEAFITTEDIVQSIKDGKLIMKNIFFELAQVPAYQSYTNEFMYVYGCNGIVPIPIDRICYLSHEDNVMMLCMKYFTNIRKAGSDFGYTSYDYITGKNVYGYHVLFMDDTKNLQNGYVYFIDEGVICDLYYNKAYKQFRTGFEKRDAAIFACNRVHESICGGDSAKSVQVNMKIVYADNVYPIQVLFDHSGDITIINEHGIQILSFADYKPIYNGNGQDMISLLQDRPGPHCTEYSMLRNLKLYYEANIILHDKSFIKYFTEGRKCMIAEYHTLIEQMKTNKRKRLKTNADTLKDQIKELTTILTSVLDKKEQVSLGIIHAFVDENKKFPIRCQLPIELLDYIFSIMGITIRIS